MGLTKGFREGDRVTWQQDGVRVIGRVVAVALDGCIAVSGFPPWGWRCEFHANEIVEWDVQHVKGDSERP